MFQQPSDKMCAKIQKLYAKRALSCFPLKDVVCVLDQDQAGGGSDRYMRRAML